MADSSFASMSTYFVPQPHDTTRGCHGDETTWNESLNSGPLRSFGKRNLILLLGRTNTADDDIDSLECLCKRFFRAF